MASVDVIIVNWNSGKQLYQCLLSIADSNKSAFTLSRVVIVDNASIDNSIQNLDEIDLPLTIIKNDKNLGFAAGCNQGARGSGAQYLLFLNPDTILLNNSLNETIIFMEEGINQNVGICGIKLFDDNGSINISCARFPTLRVLTGKITGLGKLLPTVFPPHIMTEKQIEQSGVVDQIIGAFFLVRTNLFKELNGFDERFFVYFEEVDFSLRLQQKGYSSYYLSNVNAYHKGGGCSNQIKADRLFYSLRSRLHYAYKHFSRLDLTILFFLTFFVESILRLLKAISRCSIAEIIEVITGYQKLVIALIKRRWA